MKNQPLLVDAKFHFAKCGKTVEAALEFTQERNHITTVSVGKTTSNLNRYQPLQSPQVYPVWKVWYSVSCLKRHKMDHTGKKTIQVCDMQKEIQGWCHSASLCPTRQTQVFGVWKALQVEIKSQDPYRGDAVSLQDMWESFWFNDSSRCPYDDPYWEKATHKCFQCGKRFLPLRSHCGRSFSPPCQGAQEFTHCEQTCRYRSYMKLHQENHTSEKSI